MNETDLPLESVAFLTPPIKNKVIQLLFTLRSVVQFRLVIEQFTSVYFFQTALEIQGT